MLANYTINIPSNDGINFSDTTASPANPPFGKDFGYDDQAAGDTIVVYSDGHLSVLESGTRSYQDCKADTLYISPAYHAQQIFHTGTTFCFTGHNMVAAVTIAADNLNSSPIGYVTVAVTVWEGP